VKEPAVSEKNEPIDQQAAYDAWYIAEVEKGLADVESGNVLSDDEAEEEMKIFMEQLHKKHGTTAA
jgi:predicted transcriptional regulator